MKTTSFTYKNGLNAISKMILDDVFTPLNKSKINIFLCGAAIEDKTKIRFFIAQRLNASRYNYNYNLIYPEDIFDELLYGRESKDILSLENLLADSVDVIIIIPESAGSFAELAAFASNDKLIDKIICINDQKFKNARSFINQGPIKHIKRKNKHHVIFIDKDKMSDNFDKKILDLCLSIKEKQELKVKDKLNILQLENYILPTIFLMEPVVKEEINQMVSSVIDNKTDSHQLVIVALSILLKKNLVISTINGYKLTKLGFDSFLDFKTRKKKYSESRRNKLLDEIRLEIMHLKYRNKKIKLNELEIKTF